MNFITPGGSAGSPIMESNISLRGIKLKIIITEAILGQYEGAKELYGIGVVCYFNPDNFSSYRNSIVYFTFIAKNTEGVPIAWSETYRNEFTHEYSSDERERFRFCDSRA